MSLMPTQTEDLHAEVRCLRTALELHWWQPKPLA